MAGTDASEGQTLWQPGGAEEDSRLCEGNRHLHLAYEEEEEEDCSQSTAFGALNRKARGTNRDGKTAWQAGQQHNVNIAGHTVNDGRQKSEGLAIAVLVSATDERCA